MYSNLWIFQNKPSIFEYDLNFYFKFTNDTPVSKIIFTL